MWFELERIFAQDGITIGRSLGLCEEYFRSSSVQDKKDSYFVGDAAGRADDFASTDRKFALNVGIQFYTPEVKVIYHLYGMENPIFERSQEYFLKISPAPYTLPGFHVSSIKECESLIVFTCVVP
jgi:bifunctional polynucleotide phosphatase/kinase